MLCLQPCLKLRHPSRRLDAEGRRVNTLLEKSPVSRLLVTTNVFPPDKQLPPGSPEKSLQRLLSDKKDSPGLPLRASSCRRGPPASFPAPR